MDTATRPTHYQDRDPSRKTPVTPATFATSAHAVAVTADQSKTGSVVHLIPAGSFTGRDGRGPYVLDPDAVLAAFDAWGMPVAIDYEHQSIHALENGQPAPAAGWIVALEAREDGIWGRVEWTERAAQMLGANEYRYLSPIFDHTVTVDGSGQMQPGGTVFRITGAGLTNNPNLYLQALHARSMHQAQAAQPTPSQEKRMDDLVERLCYMLNLPVTSTAEEIKLHLKRLSDSLGSTQTEAMRAMLGVEKGNVPALLEAAHARLTTASAAHAVDPNKYIPREQYDTVANSLQTLQTQVAAEKSAHAVNAAIEAGKLLPAQQYWATDYASRDPEGFAKYVAMTPSVMPTGAVATADRAAHTQAHGTYTAPAGYAVSGTHAELHARAVAHQRQHGGSFLEAVRAVAAAG